VNGGAIPPPAAVAAPNARRPTKAAATEASIHHNSTSERTDAVSFRARLRASGRRDFHRRADDDDVIRTTFIRSRPHTALGFFLSVRIPSVDYSTRLLRNGQDKRLSDAAPASEFALSGRQWRRRPDAMYIQVRRRHPGDSEPAPYAGVTTVGVSQCAAPRTSRAPGAA
jgi:hypothetical protein